jgi:hypothetical protein
MSEDPGLHLMEKICPIISSGAVIVRCKGTQCNACRPVRVEEGTIWVCALIDRDFSDTWEVADGVFA